MKTAISIPDRTFAAAEQHAAALGVTRSEFFTRAAEHYIDELDAESLTARIDEAVGLVGLDDSSAAAVGVGRGVLLAVEDEW